MTGFGLGLGIGIGPLLRALKPDPAEVLFLYQGKPITRELFKILVRYRIARIAGIVPACILPQVVCIR